MHRCTLSILLLPSHAALPGRWGENEDFEADMTAEAAQQAQQGEAGAQQRERQ